MKKYDFDTIIDRWNSDSVKYDGLKQSYGRDDLIPLWVADMDFPTPSFIIDALSARLNHPVLGYNVVPQSYYDSIRNWLGNQYDWDVDQRWISYIPGIVKGIGMVLQVFTNPGDKVIIQPPVYHPFRLVPEHNDRQIVWNPLIEENGTYRMDFDNLEKSIDEKCRVLILSNPHNPGGIVWDKESLRKLAAICHKHDILVISDEIHAEMTHKGFNHTPFATVSNEAASISITFMAPSKTFNIAGIVSSYAIVPNDSLRRKFFAYLEANELNAPSIFSVIATEAAYRHGKVWLNEMLEYVADNAAYVDDFCKKHIPGITVIRPQASFLIWLDCRKLNLSQEDLTSLFINKAHLALNDGSMFGPGGDGFMRLNIGCSRIILQKAMNQLQNALSDE